MSTRDLKFRITGDAGDAKAAFQEVSTSATAAGVGLRQADVSANTVGKSFTRTSKVFKGAGRAIKGSGLDALAASSSFLAVVPGVTAVASGLGTATIAADGLSSAFSSFGLTAAPIPALLAAAAVAAIAGAAAYAFLHDDTSAATDALRAMEKEQAKVTAAHREVALATVASREVLRDLTRAQFTQEGAAIALIEANRNLAAAQKDYGKSSLEVRSATLAQAQAEDALADARRGTIRQGQEVIANVERRKKATDDETAAVKKAAAAADRWSLGLKLGLVSGKDVAAAKRAIAKASELEADASNKSAARHRANATEARKAAAALKGDATPAVVALRKKLLELAETEMDLSQAISQIQQVGLYANASSAAVQRLTAAIAASNSASPGGGQVIGRGRVETSKGADALGVRGLVAGGNPISPSGIAGLLIEDRHRDDDLQDARIRARVTKATAKAGITNPDEIALRQERAVATARKKEILRDMGTVRKAVTRVQALIVARKKKRAKSYAKLRSIHGTSDEAKQKRADVLQTIEGHNQAIHNRYDELNGLIRQGADLQAEANLLGFNIEALNVEIEATPDVVVEEPDAAGSSDSGSDAASGAAQAGLSADQQAQLDQANARAAAAEANAAGSQAWVDTLRDSGTIDRGLGTVIYLNVEGSLIRQDELAPFIVSALRGQGSPSSGFAVSPA